MQLKDILKETLYRPLKGAKVKYFPSDNDRKFIQSQNQQNELRNMFYASFIKSGDLCFDVGANMGNRIEPLLEAGARVIAVEPQESCHKSLKSKFGDKIILIKKGLGANEELKKFYISSSSTISSYSEEWINSVKNGRFKEYNWNKQVTTQMTTLDKLIGEYGLPAFIKIDVEGYELEVLKGLSQPINLICFEYTVPEQTEKALECILQIEKNSNSIECNYSIGESMTFASERWMSQTEMMNFISSMEFRETGFGDIYVRRKTS